MLIPVDVAAISSFYFVNQKPLLYFFMIYFRQLRYWEAKSLCVHFSGKIVSHFLCESDWYWLSSTLASRFWTKESPSNQNLPYILLKTRFPFLYASTSLDTKNSFIQNTCLDSPFWKLYVDSLSSSSAHFAVFPKFSAGFFFAFGNFAHHCVVLLDVPLSDQDKKKKKRVCNGFLFLGNLDPLSVTLGGCVVLLV